MGEVTIKTTYKSGNNELEFSTKHEIPVPGYTHTVFINGCAVAYLPETVRPSKSAAEFYFTKYENGDYPWVDN